MAWPKGRRVHRYKVGQEVRYHDETITGEWHRTKVVRLGREHGQNFYVLSYDVGRIAYPHEIRAITPKKSKKSPRLSRC